MIKHWLLSCVLVSAVLFVTSSVFAEQVDNPQYKAWAKFKVDSSVTMKMDIDAQGFQISQDMVQTLKEITPEKAVINVTMTINMGGMSQNMNQTREIPAKVEKGQEFVTPDVKGTMKEVGKETVEIAGKKYDCTLNEFTGESARGGAKQAGKLWMTDQIPGGVAKMDSTGSGGAGPGGGQMQATIKGTVTAFEAK